MTRAPRDLDSSPRRWPQGELPLCKLPEERKFNYNKQLTKATKLTSVKIRLAYNVIERSQNTALSNTVFIKATMTAKCKSDRSFKN